MATAIKPLANITLSSSATSVTFSSIAAGYRDYMVVCNNLGNGAVIQINGDTASNYYMVSMRGNGTASESNSLNTNSIYTYWDNANDIVVAHFLDASATDKHKSALIRSGQASGSTTAWAARWANTSAITSISFINNSNFSSGASFALYGVSA